jgi:hypothetical protein
MFNFYDRDGKQIYDVNQISILLNNNVILEYKKGKVEIRTVHLVMDKNNSSSGSKILFKTTLINDGQEEFYETYATEEEARDGHNRLVDIVKDIKVEDVEEVEELEYYCECETSVIFNFGCQCGGI